MEIIRGRNKTQRIKNGDKEPVLADLGCEERIEFDIVKKFGSLNCSLVNHLLTETLLVMDKLPKI